MHVIKYTYTHRSIRYALFIKSLSRSPKQPEANGCSNMSRQRSFYTASGCLWKHPELFLIGTGFPGGSSNYATIPQFLGYSFIRKRQNSCTTGRSYAHSPQENQGRHTSFSPSVQTFVFVTGVALMPVLVTLTTAPRRLFRHAWAAAR